MKPDPSKPIYIAGPMTGLPQFNIPAFERAARRLRAAGYKIISPVELDSQLVRDEAMASPDGAMPAGGKIGGETWGEILGRAVRVIADQVGAIVVLPSWEKSRGARLEVFVALLCGLPIYSDAHMWASADETRPDGAEVSLQPLHRYDAIFAIARSLL